LAPGFNPVTRGSTTINRFNGFAEAEQTVETVREV